MVRIPAIEEVMTPFPDSLDVECPLGTAVEFMRREDLEYVPVVEDGTVYGVLSRGELAESALSHGLAETRLRQVCGRDALVVQSGEPLDAVLAKLIASKQRCAIVIAGSRVVGMFSAAEAFQSFHAWLLHHGWTDEEEFHFELEVEDA